MPDPIPPVVGSKPAAPAIAPSIPPVEVTVIDGTGNGGAPLQSGTVLQTPDHQPNVIVNVVTPLVAIVVRVAFMFAKSMLGFMTIAMIPPGSNQVLQAIHGMDTWHLVVTSAGLAIAPTVYDFAQSLVTVLGKLEQKYPLMTGSV
jgi:hypothetical protein